MLLGAVVGKVVVRIALLLDQRKAVRNDIVQMICIMQNMRNATRNQPKHAAAAMHAQVCSAQSCDGRAAQDGKA